MDKRAKQLKIKRRMERENIKNEKLNKMWDEMNKYGEETGRPQMKKSKEQLIKMYKATKEVDNQILNKSGVISLICSLMTIYKHYDCSTEQILTYAKKLRKFIIDMVENKRSVGLLIDEIEKDYNVPILQRCCNLPRLQMSEYNKYNMEETIIKSTVDNFPYFITINAYVFMNYLVFSNKDKIWNTEDLELFISESFKMYEEVLNDSLYLNNLNEILINERNIHVNLSTGVVKEIIKH